MKPNKTNKNRNAVATNFKNSCVASCQKALGQVVKAKAAIFVEWRDALATQERLLRLALNEAEAMAWQTNYPHLVFPILAMEKAQAVAVWNTRQRSVRRKDPLFAPGA